MKDKLYNKILLDMGWKLDWKEGERSQYSNGTLLVDVCEQKDGHHTFAMCPKNYFDRWANSRHINWGIMIESEVWSQKQIEKEFKKHVKDAMWFCKMLKPRMFNQFIEINF